MATSSKGTVNYASSSGNIEFDLEATNMQFGSDEYAIRTIDDRDSNTYEANARVGDCATRTVEDHDENTYDSLEEPYMNANLGESPNVEKDTQPGERKVRTTMTRSPNRCMCMFAVILLLVIGISVFLIVYFTSKENSEERGRCPQYTDIENGKVVNTTGSKHGDVIGIECDERNKLVGSKSVTCLSSGKWSFTPKCIPKNCDDFVITNNMIIESETNSSHVGTEIFVSCTDGYKLHGKKTTICQLDESWSDIPTCEAIDCSDPGDTANAEVIGPFNTTYNSTFHLKCNEGYNLKGSNIIRCTASGVWDELPTCEMVSCGLPDIPTHAAISDITGTSFQATATFKCDEGFYLDGNSVIRCPSNGLWTKNSTCKDIDDCTSSHCGNGTCIDGINNYTCTCSKGFTGKSCVPTDCFDLYNFDGKRTDGVYTIVTWKTHQSIQVYCDMATDGGGWTVFQYRFNGSVNFYRNFTEYEHGFGNLNTEFWLGLNYIQEVADQGQTYLRIDLESANGTRAFEKFENFYLSSGPNFTLHVGQTTDCLHISSSYRFGPYHNGMRFSTYDRDVDSWSSTNCAFYFHGAWWYAGCSHANLNGRHSTPGTADYTSMSYDSFIYNAALKSSRLMIRRN